MTNSVPPAITEEKLEALKACLIRGFEKRYQGQIDKLAAHEIHALYRKGCAVAFNYSVSRVMQPENMIVSVGLSNYSSALETLASSGFLARSQLNPLIFQITNKGYEDFKRAEARIHRSAWRRFLDFCAEHPVAAKWLTGLSIAIISLATYMLR